MNLKPVYFFVFIPIFIFPLISFAQETSDSLEVELDPIEVTALRSTVSAANAPLSLSTYSRDLQTVNHDATLSLTSLDRELPGLFVSDRQNYALGERMTIRGIGWRAQFGVRGIQVVLNDMPLTVADGQTMLNIVDPAFIRSAELVRGPAAAYWGNSSGGVLYLSTTPGYSDDGTNIRLRTMGGSYGMRKGEAEVSYTSDSHDVTAYSSYLQTNGFRDYSSATLLRSGLTGTVNLTSKSQLKYHAAGIYMPEAQHPSGLDEQTAQENPTAAVPSFVEVEAGKQITQAQSGFSYLLDTTAGIFTLTGYGIYRDLNNPLTHAIININRGVGGVRATLDKSFSNFDLQVGAETKYQHDDRMEYENNSGQEGPVQVDQIEKVWNQALFATGTYSFHNFNLLGGLRYDRLTFTTDAPTPQQSGERTFDSVSPSIGINYQQSNQTAFINLSTSFEAPTTTELVNRPGGGNGFNPALDPEQTLGLEAGIRGAIAQQAVQYDITAYRLWIQDLLFPYQLETDGATFYRNQGETNHTGIEGKVSWRLNNNWNIATTANIMNAEFIQAETVEGEPLAGNEVPGIPQYRINNRVSWSPADILLSASHQYVSSYAANNLNTANNDAYHVFDAKLSYRGNVSNAAVQLQPFINVNNIFNTHYNGSVVVNAFGGRFFEPAPDRNWRLGVSVLF